VGGADAAKLAGAAGKRPKRLGANARIHRITCCNNMEIPFLTFAA
jgi:hypothetical protein